MMTDLGQPKKGHFIASGGPEVFFSRGMSKYVEISDQTISVLLGSFGKRIKELMVGVVNLAFIP